MYQEAVKRALTFYSRDIGDEQYAKSKLLEKIHLAEQTQSPLPPLYATFRNLLRDSMKLKATASSSGTSPSRFAALNAIRNKWLVMYSTTDINEEMFAKFLQQYRGKRICGMGISRKSYNLIAEALSKFDNNVGDHNVVSMLYTESEVVEVHYLVSHLRRKLIAFWRWCNLMQLSMDLTRKCYFLVRSIAPDLFPEMQDCCSYWSQYAVTTFSEFLQDEDDVTQKQHKQFMQAIERYAP